MSAGESGPRIAVLSTLFPHPGAPVAGVFIRERMAWVARELPVVVLAPTPWFPGQALLRRWRPGYRPDAPRHETQGPLTVYRPRFLALPGIGRSLDGVLMAIGCLGTLRRLSRERRVELIDAHFAYPDGFAASLLGRLLRVPVTITLRGTEPRLGATLLRGAQIRSALMRARRVLAVSGSLRDWAISAGVDPARITVASNGVDTERFRPVDRRQARERLGLPPTAPVLITVGGLTERKGFHRVIECLPTLLRRWPRLRYLIVGGASAEGDWRERLERQAAALGVAEAVTFLGVVAPEALHEPLSAADVFVLATRNEGCANVLLEAQACGLPVVTTDVGGNREIVAGPELGRVVPFGDRARLESALIEALVTSWDRDAIRCQALDRSWDARTHDLVRTLRAAAGGMLAHGERAGEFPVGRRSVMNQQTWIRSLKRRLRRNWRRATKSSVQALRMRMGPDRPRRQAFVVGAQRSGTNMVMNLLDRSYETTVFHETDPRAFDDYYMREAEVIQALIDDAPGPLVVIKALCEMDRLAWLMARFAPARAIWIVRNYDDAVSSSLRSFTQVAGQVAAIVRNRNAHPWIGRGMSDVTHERLRDLYTPGMTDATAVALFWYIRNRLLYDAGFHRDPRVLVVSYDRLVANPGEELRRLFDFLDIAVPAGIPEHVSSTSLGRGRRPDIGAAVRAECDRLHRELLMHAGGERVVRHALDEALA